MTTSPRLEVTGHYAGPVSRAAGGVLDIAIVLVSFALGIAGIDLLARYVISGSLIGDRTGVVSVIALALWGFLYMYASLAIAGRTPGMALIGLRVVAADGLPLSNRRALGRTLAFPLSALLFGLGFLIMFVQREHRALHDLIAGTAVVYDWGSRPAELPAPLSDFLARRAGVEYTPIGEDRGTAAGH